VANRGRGPLSYENWLSFRDGVSPHERSECPLFSDAYFTGEVTSGLGPYELLNPIAHHDEGSIRPALILRQSHCLTHDLAQDDMTRTDYSRYHGASPTEEFVALLSLSLGVRLKSGGVTRVFEERHPLGRPVMYAVDQNPDAFRIRGPARVIPGALGTRCINGLDLAPRFPDLAPSDAMALVLAARQYQEALWVAEVQPALSWVIFVSAVEVAANHWRAAQEEPRERLAASHPELEDVLLSAAGEEFVTSVAALLAPYLGATRKFVDFCLTFMPAEPERRPPPYAQHPWDAASLEVSLKRVYDYRSRALHGGTPFPSPMCQPPFLPEGGVYAEKPHALAYSAQGGVWTAADIPMFLQTFEYIVRNALLSWWGSMYHDETLDGA